MHANKVHKSCNNLTRNVCVGSASVVPKFCDSPKLHMDLHNLKIDLFTDVNAKKFNHFREFECSCCVQTKMSVN